MEGKTGKIAIVIERGHVKVYSDREQKDLLIGVFDYDTGDNVKEKLAIDENGKPVAVSTGAEVNAPFVKKMFKAERNG